MFGALLLVYVYVFVYVQLVAHRIVAVSFCEKSFIISFVIAIIASSVSLQPQIIHHAVAHNVRCCVCLSIK